MKRFLAICLLSLCAIESISQTLTDSNLPIIVINTGGQEILDDPKITADMGIVNNGTGVRNNITDAFTEYNGKIGIEIRGQSSQMFPMKSYGLELRDATTGKSQDKPLFGLPKESDWVLYAPYNDKTLMHNFLAYTLSREMGHWAANCRYVELVIDGDYKGIYVFMEKIKRNSGRVNVPKMAATDIDGDAVTGGYVFSLDKDANAWYSSISTKPSTNNNVQFSYVYPKVEDIVPEQEAYIKSYVDSFENVLNGPQFQDPQQGWRKFADESSFIDFLIINEISRNVDGYRLSSYFYKDRQSKGGKIIAGPVWDYDLGFRNANYCQGAVVTGWAYKFNYICGGDTWQIPFWWDQFEQDTAFQSNLRCRWKALRQTTLSDNHLNFLIDSIVTLTAEARTRHFERWPVLGTYVWPNPDPIPADYPGEITSLKNWLAERVSWIGNTIPNKGACSDLPPLGNASSLIKFYPDPVPNQLFVSIQSAEDQLIQLNIYDAMGRKVRNQSYQVASGLNVYTIFTSGWGPGIYIVRYEAAGGEKGAVKLVKN